MGKEGTKSALRLRWQVRLHAHSLDREIAAGADPDASPMLRLRSEQLTAPGHRAKLAAQIDQVIDMAERTAVVNSAELPLDRPEVIEARAWFLQLRDALAGADPVTARGVAMTLWLLRNRESPIFAPVGIGEEGERRPGALAPRVQATLAALEPGADDSSSAFSR